MTDQPEVDPELATAGSGGATDGARDLENAPPVPAEAQEELLALKSGAVFLCSRPDGEIWPGQVTGEGLYAGDTRHLSELRVTVGGLPPIPLSSTMESGYCAVINGTNPTLRGDDGLTVPQDTLNVRRTVLVADRLYYRIVLRNYRPRAVTIAVTAFLASDFADVFEIRSIGPHREEAVQPASQEDGRLRFACLAADGGRRETSVELSPEPTSVELDGSRARATWAVAVGANEAVSLLVAVAPSGEGSPAPTPTPDRSAEGGRVPAPTLERAAEVLDAEHREWVSRCTGLRTDNELFDRFIDASVRDLHALMMPLGDVELPAAGIPWYVAPFGRDSLLTARESLMVNPEIARGTLLALSRLQATEDDPLRDAEPGKILHELRVGELARTGRIPHTPYFGTVDATPLFLMVAGEYYRWTLDVETMAALRPSLDAALEWIDVWGDRDGDGFIEYQRRAPGGLMNQGWKDSHDAVIHADGAPAEGPIAVVEAQGYVYEAKLLMADVYAALGDLTRPASLRTEAASLRSAFNEAFWDARNGYFALALDGRKAPVRSVASNPAHCLYCGIVDEDKAARVAERLMAPDMFSGWGIRTLSSLSPVYNPMSYHNGSVWPHDNAIAAAGLKRYGLDDDAVRIAAALFDVASSARDFRLPELFCGFSREESRSIVSYPVACIPQAWAAASPFLLLQSALGISPDATGNRLDVNRPRLPAWLSALEISNLRVADSRVSLSFNTTATGSTGFAQLDQRGDVSVKMLA